MKLKMLKLEHVNVLMVIELSGSLLCHHLMSALQQYLVINLMIYFHCNVVWVSKNCTRLWTEVQVMLMCCYGVSRAALTMRSLSNSLTPWQGKLRWEGPLNKYECLVRGSSVMVQEIKSVSGLYLCSECFIIRCCEGWKRPVSFISATKAFEQENGIYP